MGLAADISAPLHSAAIEERIPPLVSTREAAALLHRHPRTVRRLAATGCLNAHQFVGAGKGLLFDLDEVMELRRSGYRSDRPKAAA
jgi:excisionase family DNA binding protein